MTQPQRGSARSEVDDLRNIVDRLDLLMGGATSSAGPADGRAGVDRTVAELLDRVGALEDQVDELRTLVNHLMTIATWQAKVTAQLVDDELGDAPDEADERYGDGPPAGHRDVGPTRPPADGSPPRRGPGDAASDERPPPRFEQRREDAPRHQQHAGRPHQTTTLDEDIDDILGVDRRPTSDRDSSPPDFGI